MKTDKENTLIDFQLLTSQVGKQRRTEKLLKPSHGESPSFWFMCLPVFFNNALDIKDTERKKDKKSYWVWTQGADFSFSTGDTIYDTNEAYKTWSEAIKKINICIQVTQAVPASSSETGLRFPGRVTADLYLPDISKTKLNKVTELKMTQYEFVSLLIFGPEKPLSDLIDSNQSLREN